MADLHTYIVRQQFWRDIPDILALNTNHAKDVAELDVQDMEDTDSVKATTATLVEEDAGVDANGVSLDKFAVTVRARRNFEVLALDKQDARAVTQSDTESFGNVRDVVSQSVTQVREKSGVSA